MNTNLTDITFILDRSGSMASVAADTIGGFNSFLESQRKLPGEATVSLFQFDDIYETVYSGQPLKDAPALNADTFVPRGMTALMDAIGRTINATGKRLEALPAADRPGKVVIVILTDGGENSSKEFRRNTVAELISHQKEKYNWDFVFVGANQDAIATGRDLNIDAGKSMTYAHNVRGTKSAFDSLASYTSNVRLASVGAVANVQFSAQDRQEQQDAGA